MASPILEQNPQPLKLCEICAINPRQYKCPRCFVMTCSLQCCRKHKIKSSCTGQRDRAAYVSIQGFEEKTLRSDFHFLEDILQSKDSAKRVLLSSCGGVRKHSRDDESEHTNVLLKSNIETNECQAVRKIARVDTEGGERANEVINEGKASDFSDGRMIDDYCQLKADDSHGLVMRPQQQSASSPSMPLLKTVQNLQHLDMYSASVKRFVKATANRGTRVILMSPGMTKRKLNSTQFRPKSDQIYWKINVVFIISKKIEAPCLLRFDLDTNGELKVVEDALVGISVANIYEETTIENFLNEFFDHRQGNSIIRHTLRPLRLRREELKCFMQRIPSPANNPLFIQVSRDDSIRKMLEGKTIIEYPTLFVGIDEDVRKFNFLISIKEKADTENSSCSNSKPNYINKDSHVGFIPSTKAEKTESKSNDMVSYPLLDDEGSIFLNTYSQISNVQEGGQGDLYRGLVSEIDENDEENLDDEGADEYLRDLIELQKQDISQLTALLTES